MAYFPFMIEVDGHKALVVGAGQSAKEKIRALTDFGADVTVVAPVISADVVKQGKNIRIERRVYRPGETKGYEIVVAATDNPAVNKQVAHDAARFGAICSVAGSPERGGFIFPQIIKRNSYSVAVCTEGMDDKLAAKLKEKIQDAVPEKADEIAALFSRARKKLDEQMEDGAEGENKTRLADYADISEGVTSGGSGLDGASGLVSGRNGGAANGAGGLVSSPDDETANGADGLISGRVSGYGDGAGGQLGFHFEESGAAAEHDDAGVSESDVIRVGTLQDRLSQVRAGAVITKLEAKGYKCEKVLIECPDRAGSRPDAGDRLDRTTIMNAEEALSGGLIDVAVRSAGGLPPVIPDGLAVDFCLPREDARDVLVTRKGTGDKEIEVIETDCLSRKVQIEKFLRTGEARVSSEGIQVLINRLKAGETDAAVLAAADLEKMLVTEDEELECEFIDVNKSLPPACQGITVLETRSSGKAYDAASTLSDKEAGLCFRAERRFMVASGSTRDDEAACHSAINGGRMFMKVMKRAGQRCVYFAGMDDPENGEKLADHLIEKMGS